MAKHVMIACLALALLAGAADGNEPVVTVALYPAGPKATSIQVPLLPGKTEVTAGRIYLRQSGAEPLADVALLVLRRGRPIAVDVNDVSDGKIVVPAKGGEVGVVLKLRDVASTRDESLALQAGFGGKSVELATLQLKAAAPALTIRGQDNAGKVTFKTDNADREIPIVVRSSAAIPLDVAASIDDLTDPGGTRVTPTVKSKTALITAGGEATVNLTPNVKRHDTYTGTLTLAYGDVRQRFEVVVEYVKRPLALEIEPLGSIPSETLNPLASAPAFVVVVKETAGRPLEAKIPRLYGVQKKAAPGGKDETISCVNLTVCEGGKSIGKLVLKANERKELAVRVHGLGGPGEYAAELRVEHALGDPVTADLTLLVRVPWYYAALAVLAGALLAYRLHNAAGERERLVHQVSVSKLDEALDRIMEQLGSLEPRPAQVHDTLRRHIQVLFVNAATSDAVTIKTQIGNAKTCLSLFEHWALVWQNVKNAGKMDALKSRLVAVGQTLERPAEAAGKHKDLHTKIDAIDLELIDTVVEDESAKILANAGAIPPTGVKELLAEAKSRAGEQKRTEALDNLLRAGLLVDVRRLSDEVGLQIQDKETAGEDVPEELTQKKEALDKYDAGSSSESLQEAVGETSRRIPLLPVATHAEIEIPDSTTIAKRIAKRDRLVLYVVILIAGLLGVLALYAKNPVWGDWDDWLVAFLWGLGIQSASGGKFTGIHGLIKAFKG